MEYDKQIEIKIDGNNCIINIPSDQNLSSKSLNKILSQNNNSLTNIDDISFSVSLTEENMNSRNNFYNQNYENNKNNNYSNKKSNLYSNEKSKLEITYQSIFNSELKSESSNIKTPLLLLNSKNNEENIQQQKKDCEKKHSRLLEEINNYKRRLSQLNKELNIYKYGKKNPSNAEDFKNKFNINTETAITPGQSQILSLNEGGKGEKSLKQIISHRSNSHGITRVVEKTSQEIGNAIITTRTTQISYKSKKGSQSQKQI